jgi:hypothetical protein
VASYSDDFNRASLGANWTAVNAGNWNILSSVRARQETTGDYRALRYATGMDGADVDASVVIRASGSGYYGGGVLVRCPTSGTALTDIDGYAILMFPGDAFYIVRLDNGDDGGVGYGYVWGSVSTATDYTLRITVAGTTITGYVDGTQRFTFTDSTYAGGSGNRGVALLAYGATPEWDSFSAADIASGVTVAPGAAIAEAGAVAPTVEAGGITIAPAVAISDAGAVAPGVALGAVTVSPAAAVSVASAGDYALRFYGNATGQIDRVRIPLEDGASTQYPVNVGAGSFTYDFWLRCNYADNTTTATDARYANIVADRDDYNAQRGHVVLGVTRRSGVLVACFGQAGSGGTWATLRTTSNIGDGQWHHVAVTRNISNGQVIIWIDGVNEASGTYDTTNWSIPAGHTNGSGLDNEFFVLGTEKHDVGSGYNGQVDEMLISDSVRYTATFTPARRFEPDANAMGLYHLDDAAGTVARDSATVTGAPTNGELLVGGSPSGPVWVGLSPVVVIGGITVAPAAAISEAGAAAPGVVLGAVTVAPDAAISEAGAAAPGVVLGAVTVAPAAAISEAGAAAPGVVLGAVTVAPDAAISEAGAAAPGVVLGAVVVAPGAAISEAGAIAPTVDVGGGAITPAAAIAEAGAAAPGVVLGAVVVAPVAAISEAGAVAPTVLAGGITVAPAATIAEAGAAAPTVVLGAVVVAPAAAISEAGAAAPGVVYGATTATPAAAVAEADALAPVVIVGVIAALITLRSRRSFGLTATYDIGLTVRRGD